MLIKFFCNGKGAGAGPVGYLVAGKVLAYDDNRDLIRDAEGQPITVTREPFPVVLRGNPERTEALIDLSRHRRPDRGTASRGHGRIQASDLRGAEATDLLPSLEPSFVGGQLCPANRSSCDAQTAGSVKLHCEAPVKAGSGNFDKEREGAINDRAIFNRHQD